ncbi:MAG: VOC family protein [Myxococcota bacterium]
MAVKPVPERYHTLTPFLTVKDAAGLIEFLKRAFGAVEHERIEGPPGVVRHGELQVGDSMVMLAEASAAAGGSVSSIYMYVENVDETYKKAIEAGAQPLTEVMNMPFGDRSGGVVDPAGNRWWISTHIEDVDQAELMRRMMGGRR